MDCSVNKDLCPQTALEEVDKVVVCMEQLIQLEVLCYIGTKLL